MYKLTVDEDTWIISDTHFGHANIIKYCNRPKNHDSVMLSNWSQMIGKDDLVLHLGDLMVWYPDVVAIKWAERVKKLPGRKYIIFGNHDVGKQGVKAWFEKDWKRLTGFTPIKPFLQKNVYFSHEATSEGQGLINIHGHSHDHAPFGPYEILGYTYYNASIEGQSYRPKRLGEILQEIRNA